MDDLNNNWFSPILNHNYAQYFKEVQYNGLVLSEAERKEFVNDIDATILQYSEGLPMMQDILENNVGFTGEFYELLRIVASVMLFTHITMVDSMVASKYFILADKDYDKRFMRGKLMVILNEGFKRLYGFDNKTHKQSEWDKLLPLMRYMPENINHQYQELTYHLEKHAKSSSWWREERNLETHLVAEQLYYSRQQELIESKVMIDTLKLFSTVLAVTNFLYNVYTCFHNYIVEQYRNGKIKA